MGPRSLLVSPTGRAPGEADQLNEPKLLTGLLDEQVVMASCGARHTALVLGGGQVATCGDGAHGKLGHGTDEAKPEFILVAALGAVHISQVSCGRGSAAGTGTGERTKFCLDIVRADRLHSGTPLSMDWASTESLAGSSRVPKRMLFNHLQAVGSCPFSTLKRRNQYCPNCPAEKVPPPKPNPDP